MEVSSLTGQNLEECIKETARQIEQIDLRRQTLESTKQKKVTLQTPGGSVYTGDAAYLRDDLVVPHGFGKVTFSQADNMLFSYYEGAWVAGSKHGEGDLAMRSLPPAGQQQNKQPAQKEKEKGEDEAAIGLIFLTQWCDNQLKSISPGCQFTWQH
eukprot:TRINITY_DN5491_c0_g1_i2.p2 TRINITY_DN5491_c0_g1~~TRINITY_DN5491_c0_g1_i2.p2  ORF type:complete len:155 (-),score=37.34 TRINITY_DN5491_c0_g1_i2:7-471(-)